MADSGKMSLLEIVQNILGAMSSDSVNSIGDTIEAYDVAVEVKTTFYELIGGIEAPLRKGIFKLDALSDVTRPTHMLIPNNVKDIETVRFDTQANGKITWKEVCYLEPEEFINLSTQYSNDTAVLQVTDNVSGVPFYVKTDQNPTYYTSFDDEHLVFDSYDSSSMSSLVEIRTMAVGYLMPNFRLEDTYIPDLPADMFPLLLSEAKQAAFINIKQVSNAKEEQRSRRQRVRRMNNQRRANLSQNLGRDYGRKPKI